MSISRSIVQPVARAVAAAPTGVMDAAAAAGLSPVINWRADSYSGSAGSYVFENLGSGGSAYDGTQQSGTMTASTGAGGVEKFVCSGVATVEAATARAVREGWYAISVFKRADTQPVGFHSFEGATPYPHFWDGYETLNRRVIYVGNGATYTGMTGATDANSHTSVRCYDSCYSPFICAAKLDGKVTDTTVLPRGANTSSLKFALGSKYRALVGDWYETRVYTTFPTQSELNTIYAELEARYTDLSINKPSDRTLTPTLAIWGQSNAVGRVPMVDLPVAYQGSQTGVNIYLGSAGNYQVLNADVSNNNQTRETPNNRWAYESLIGKDYIDANGGSIYIMKSAAGSTSLAWDSSDANWAIDPANDWSTTGNQCTSFGKYWYEAMQEMHAAGLEPDLKGICIAQGEDDGLVEAHADAWAANFTTVCDWFDSIMENRTAPIIFTRVADDGTETYKDTVRAQQAIADAVSSRRHMIDTDAFGMIDNVHYNATGMRSLSDAMLALLDT